MMLKLVTNELGILMDEQLGTGLGGVVWCVQGPQETCRRHTNCGWKKRWPGVFFLHDFGINDFGG